MKGKGKIKVFFADFKKFISRGNILDMAVGVIVGGAFSAIVTAFTNKIIMPLINWLLAAITGGDGLKSARTILGKPIYDAVGNVDWTNTIYIDWGLFITAILDFLIIAFTLFLVLKIVMSASGYLRDAQKALPTKEEKKALREQGVDMRDHKAVLLATAELREKNKPAPEPPKPTQEELLTSILEELRKQNAEKEVTNEASSIVKTRKKKAE